jgi:hypothetical protein
MITKLIETPNSRDKVHPNTEFRVKPKNEDPGITQCIETAFEERGPSQRWV